MFKVIITGCVCILLSCNNPIRDKGPGSIKWMVSTDRIGWCSPAIGPDGAIYIGDNAGVLYAIYDHDSAWSFKCEPQKIDDDC